MKKNYPERWGHAIPSVRDGDRATSKSTKVRKHKPKAERNTQPHVTYIEEDQHGPILGDENARGQTCRAVLLSGNKRKGHSAGIAS